MIATPPSRRHSHGSLRKNFTNSIRDVRGERADELWWDKTAAAAAAAAGSEK